MVLTEASDVDLVAAVVGADAWMLIAAANDLYTAPGYGRAASEVYMNVLLRAAGCGAETPSLSDRVATSESAIATADGYRRWATALVGPAAPEALRRAAGDLAAGGVDTEFGKLGAVLVVAADAYYLERDANEVVLS
jgi:hypothetical protein